MRDLRPGDRFQHFEIEAVVYVPSGSPAYRALDTLLGRRVVVEFRGTPGRALAWEERQRMLANARLLARISDPHLVAFLDAQDLGSDGVVLEWEHCPGRSLERRLAEGWAPTQADTVRILRGAACALRALHDQHAMHGDVGAGGILFGAADLPKLLPRPGARVDPEEATRSSGKIVGIEIIGPARLQGLAPEELCGERQVPASDIWAVGILAYLLLGVPEPFQRPSLPALFFAIVHEPPVPLGDHVPPLLVDLVARCLAKAPEERPWAADVVSALDEIAGETT
jgi:serine/threonine-protein kinase